NARAIAAPGAYDDRPSARSSRASSAIGCASTPAPFCNSPSREAPSLPSTERAAQNERVLRLRCPEWARPALARPLRRAIETLRSERVSPMLPTRARVREDGRRLDAGFRRARTAALPEVIAL